MTKNNLVEVLDELRKRCCLCPPPDHLCETCEHFINANNAILDWMLRVLGDKKKKHPYFVSVATDNYNEGFNDLHDQLTAKIEAERKKETMDEKAVTGWTPC